MSAGAQGKAHGETHGEAAVAPIDCPLCGYGFSPSKACASGCPMSQGCGMIKCPNCGYEFVERSAVLDGVAAFVSKWWRRARRGAGEGSGAAGAARALPPASGEEGGP